MKFVYSMWYKVEDPKEQVPFWMLMTRDGIYTMPRGGGPMVRKYHHHAKDWRNLGPLCGKDKAIAGEHLVAHFTQTKIS